MSGRIPRSAWTRRTVVAVGAAVVLAAISWHVTHVPDSYPLGDEADTGLYTLMAGKGELSTGAYSRFHWHHPGPLLYQLLAPAYRLSGFREVSLKWAMLAINLSVLSVLLLSVRRRAPLLALAIAIALAPFIYFEQRLLFWTWNPVAPLLSVALAVAIAARVGSGEVMWLPALAAVLSFLVQAHVGLTPVSALLAVVSLALLWFHTRPVGGPSGSTLAKGIVAALLVTTALWAVPVIHEFMPGGGNLRQLLTFWTAPHPRHSWQEAADVFAYELSLPAATTRETITGDLPAAASGAARIWAGIYLVLLPFAARLAYRRGAKFEYSFALLCLAASVTAIFVIRTVVDDILEYFVTWAGVVGSLGFAAIATEIAVALRPRIANAGASHLPESLALAAYLVAAAALGVSRLDYKQRLESTDHQPLHLAGALEQYADSHGFARPVLSFSQPAWGGATAVVLQLFKDGRTISIADDGLFLFPATLARNGQEPAEFYLMMADESDMPAGVDRFEWIVTAGRYRLVRLFRH